MKTRIPIYVILFCFLPVFLNSCINSDDYEFDKLSDKMDWQPNFVAPIGYGEYTMEYLLDQHEENEIDKTIVIDEDGLIHIKHSEKGIFSYETNEILDFPAQPNNTLDLTLPTLNSVLESPVETSREEVSLGIDTDKFGIILKEMKTNFILDFKFNNPLNTDIDLEVNLISGTQNGAAVIKTYTIKSNAVNQIESLDLTDLLLSFKEPLSTENLIEISFKATIKPNGGNVSGSGSLNINYQINKLEFILAKGDFGNQTLDLASKDIDLNVNFWDDINGSFTFTNPQISLNFNNQIGVPFKIETNMSGSNSEGTSLSLNPEVQFPDYPTTVAQVLEGVEASITYNKDNSEIVPFMALPPSENISFYGSISINENSDGTKYNPLAEGNNLNIISGASSISFDLDLDIPLDFKADNLSISDTIDGVDIDDTDKMLKAAIIITSENGLPLDVRIDKIYFTDKDYTKIDSLHNIDIIKTAQINETTGEVDPTTISKEVSQIALTEKQIENLKYTENIIINASISTSENGTKSVKIKGTDKLKFSLSVNAQINLFK